MTAIWHRWLALPERTERTGPRPFTATLTLEIELEIIAKDRGEAVRGAREVARDLQGAVDARPGCWVRGGEISEIREGR